MQIRVVIVGYGPMGRMHAGLLGQQDGVSIVAVADPEAELRARAEHELGAATFDDAVSLVGSVQADVAFVCSPTYLHAEHTIAALRAGFHVFCEKPMGMDPAQCDRMIAASRSADRILTVGQVLRFWPEYVYLKRILDTGELGRLRTLSLYRVGQVTRGWRDWFLDERRGGTQIFDRHIHDTDLVLWLLGAPLSVLTVGREEPVGGYVHSFTHYAYPSVTVLAEGSADYAPPFPFTMAYTAALERATVSYSNRVTPTLTVYHEDGGVTMPELPIPLGELQTGLNITSTSAYYYEQVEFLRCVREGRRPEVVSPESARETVRLARLEMESARRGTAVRVPEA